MPQCFGISFERISILLTAQGPKSLHGPYLMHIISSSSHPSREQINAHQARSQGVTWALASPAQKNWVGQEKNFSSRPFKLLENPFFSICYLFLTILDKQLSQAAFFVTVAFMPVGKSKSIRSAQLPFESR